MFGSYDCTSLKQLLDQGGKLIDVRSHFEYTQGALQGALSMLSAPWSAPWVYSKCERTSISLPP